MAIRDHGYSRQVILGLCAVIAVCVSGLAVIALLTDNSFTAVLHGLLSATLTACLIFLLLEGSIVRRVSEAFDERSQRLMEENVLGAILGKSYPPEVSKKIISTYLHSSVMRTDSRMELDIDERDGIYYIMATISSTWKNVSNSPHTFSPPLRADDITETLPKEAVNYSRVHEWSVFTSGGIDKEWETAIHQEYTDDKPAPLLNDGRISIPETQSVVIAPGDRFRTRVRLGRATRNTAYVMEQFFITCRLTLTVNCPADWMVYARITPAESQELVRGADGLLTTKVEEPLMPGTCLFVAWNGNAS